MAEACRTISTSAERLRLLRRIPLFARLTTRDLDGIAQSLVVRLYPPKATILSEGDSEQGGRQIERVTTGQYL